MSAPTDNCLFCRKIVNGGDEHGPVVELPEGVFRFEPLNPVAEGHMLFVPGAHVADASEANNLAGRCFAAASAHGFVMAEPFNLITSAGAEATQTVRHLHVHYVPRRANDGLPLPWSEVRADLASLTDDLEAVRIERDQLNGKWAEALDQRDRARNIAVKLEGENAYLGAEADALQESIDVYACYAENEHGPHLVWMPVPGVVGSSWFCPGVTATEMPPEVQP